ncbi:MAG: DUF5107 domain-containing protein [Chloroflexota bacterium]|nr:DUF5107 domain-containing protein [Chloroflexota bacterium]
MLPAKAQLHKFTSLRTFFLLLTLLAGGLIPPSAPVQAQDGGRFYPETGKTLAPEFIGFYDANGGVPVFGYPLTDAETEGGLKVQYLERARVEYHPDDSGTPYEVQLGLLGSALNAGRHFSPVIQDYASSTSGRRYFPETKHSLSGVFLQYWQRTGGLALFGYPLSEAENEGGYTVQYFQRNRFELHPDLAGTPYEVQLGLLGRDLLAQRVQVQESSVTLPVYGYEQGFYTPENDPLAPYPRLNMASVGSAQMRTYRLIVLENHYLRLSVLPQLGGRLYEAVYKPTGHDELYRNPVIKPSTFGARGWWLAAGGTEWAAPVEEHGLMEYLPWDYAVQRNGDGGVTVKVSQTDKLTGMLVAGSVTLSPESGSYTLRAQLENHTSKNARGQLWTNAMLAPGGTNHLSSRTRFVVPAVQMVVHSTSDPDLPPAHDTISWPAYEGRDLANMSNWKGWLGAFALPVPQRGEFAGVYNPDADEGMVESFKGAELPGLKIFGFGPGFDTHIYTDDNSNYVELWSGVTPTFWDSALFPPGSSLGIQENWQPVAKVGGISLASSWGTVSLASGVARILPARRTEGGTLVVYGPGGTVTRYLFDAYPDRPVVLPISGSVASIEVLDGDAHVVLRGVPLGQP